MCLLGHIFTQNDEIGGLSEHAEKTVPSLYTGYGAFEAIRAWSDFGPGSSIAFIVFHQFINFGWRHPEPGRGRILPLGILIYTKIIGI
jgi:hypothetical protein